MPLVSWTDAEKVALLLSIIDSQETKKIDWEKVDTQGRTVKACTHALANLRAKCAVKASPGKGNGDDNTLPATPKPAKAKNSKKSPPSLPANSSNDDGDHEAKKKPTKKRKIEEVVTAVKEEPRDEVPLGDNVDPLVA